jgi:hypothetical protein
MAILSNAQGLLFTAFWTEQTKVEAASTTTTTTLKGWFGSQQMGQTKAMITDAVVSNRGVVTHTVGDAMLCSFADPKSALKAAAAIQSRVTKSANPGSGMVVKARIGVAYGQVRVIAGKVSGDAVNAAGILMEKCSPGEVLVDQALVTAIGGARDLALEPHGNVDGIAAFRMTAFGSAADDTTRMAAMARGPAPAPSAPAPAAAAPAPAPAAPPPARAPAAPAAPAPRVPAAPVARAVASAIILKFGGVEQRFQPSDGDVRIGRGSDNQVIVPLPYASRKHAKIVWRENSVPYLVNLSQNGTCVRLRDSGREVVCTSEMPLEGSGDIVLCDSFALATSAAEIVTYRLTP